MPIRGDMDKARHGHVFTHAEADKKQLYWYGVVATNNLAFASAMGKTRAKLAYRPRPRCPSVAARQPIDDIREEDSRPLPATSLDLLQSSRV